MSQSKQQGVHITLLGKEMTIACPDGQAEALLNAARYLNDKMQDIKDKGGNNSPLNLALMAALNISHELLQANEAKQQHQSQIEQRIRLMEQAIEQSLLDKTAGQDADD